MRTAVFTGFILLFSCVLFLKSDQQRTGSFIRSPELAQASLRELLDANVEVTNRLEQREKILQTRESNLEQREKILQTRESNLENCDTAKEAVATIETPAAACPPCPACTKSVVAPIVAAPGTAVCDKTTYSRVASAYFNAHRQEFDGYAWGDLEFFRLLHHLDPGGGKEFIDVGMNRGIYSMHFLRLWSCGDFLQMREKIDEYNVKETSLTCGSFGPTRVHAFEANPQTFIVNSKVTSLWETFKSSLPVPALIRNNIAVSSTTGKLELFNNGDISYLGGGVGLAKPGQTGIGKVIGTVDVTTIDAYLEAHKITKEVFYAKFDAEGVDMEVIMGSKKAINRGQLRMFQVEVCPEIINNIANICALGPFHAYLLGTKNLLRVDDGWSEFSKPPFHMFANILFIRPSDPLYKELLVRFNTDKTLQPCWE